MPSPLHPPLEAGYLHSVGSYMEDFKININITDINVAN